MNVQAMVELTKMKFPDKGTPEILHRIGWAQREFAGETRCLIKEYDFTPSTSPFSDRYEIEEVEIDTIKLVRFLDSSGTVLSKMDNDLNYYITNRYLYICDWDGQAITAYPTALVTIRATIVYLPAEITSISESLEVEERFHRGILARVFADFYAAMDNFNAAMYYKGEYKDAVREGKKYANSEGSSVTRESVTGIL